MTLQEYRVKNNRQELLEQWDAEKNETLTPQQVSAGSGM